MVLTECSDGDTMVCEKSSLEQQCATVPRQENMNLGRDEGMLCECEHALVCERLAGSCHVQAQQFP